MKQREGGRMKQREGGAKKRHNKAEKTKKGSHADLFCMAALRFSQRAPSEQIVQ